MQKNILVLLFCWAAVCLFGSAFDILVRLTNFGTRQPNSAGIEQARSYIVDELANLKNCSVKQDSFVAFLRNKPQKGVNIIAKLNPKISPRILLCTHYDTRFKADNDPKFPHLPVLGANDGASGVAALLTLAKKFSEESKNFGIDFAFFDLEDQGKNSSSENWILGSKNYAQKIDSKRYKLVILLDMVAGKKQIFCQEKFAQAAFPELNQSFWQAANFSSTDGKYICDDHLPFILQGIPTIAVIGWPFPHHHTTQDIVQNCSPETLNKVIDATYKFIKLHQKNQHNSK